MRPPWPMVTLPRAAVVLAVSALLGLVAAPPTPASGQAAATTTTSTSSTTTTTAAPTTTAPVPLPPALGGPTTTTTTTAPPAEPTQGGADDEVGADEPPPTGVSVPPPATPPPAPSANDAALRQLVGKQLKQARADLGRADRTLGEAAARVVAANAAWEASKAKLDGVQRRSGELVVRLAQARQRMVQRALGAYTGEDLSRVNGLLEAGDINEFARRSGLLEGVLRSSKATIDEYAAAKKAAGAQIATLVTEVNRSWSDLQVATGDASSAGQVATQTKIMLDALDAGSLIAVKGFVFPVAAPHRFSNDFGAPRLVGTPLAHTHQGNDIFAVMGAPLVACERGVVTRIGVDRLGGNKLWIVGQSGTAYYYAHLSAYAAGLVEGQVVEAGTLVGYVGNTGDARGGPTHLHFEVHPNGGPAVNPYFLLKAVDDAARMAPPPTASSSGPPPTPVP